MYEEVKDSLRNIYSLCDNIQAFLMGSDEDITLKGKTLKSQLRKDLLYFATYMICTDGHISRSEAKYISEVFGLDMTPSQIKQKAEERRIYTDIFDKTIPKSFQLFVKIDNQLHDAGQERILSDLLIALYANMGKQIIECDNYPQGNSLNMLKSFLSSLAKYQILYLSFEKEKPLDISGNDS